MEKPPVFEADDLVNIKASYDKNGFVCVRLLNRQECDERVRVARACPLQRRSSGSVHVGRSSSSGES